MAETEAMAPSRAAPRRNAANGATRTGRSSPRAKPDDLEAQVAQLQNDLKAITHTLGRMGETTVGEVRSTAKARAAEIRGKGEELIESAQDEFGALEKQVKDTIREKPLTAVAGAIALGFVLAVITR